MSSQDVRINFKGDAADAVRAAKSLETVLNAITKQADAATKQLKNTGTGFKTDAAVREGKKLEKQLKDTSDAGDKLKRSFAGIGSAAKAGLAGVGVALAGLAVGAKKSVDAAVNLGEQLNKAKVVFRGAEQSVIAFSKTSASALGISQRAALEAAGTFGNMLVPMGFARGEAAKMSTSMVALAADMASFNNASPEETLQALRSGLAGETEPLRKFGVFLNEARVQAEAMSLGLIKQGETLTAAGKAAAVYSIIMKDTKDAQGDFANTSKSLANQQRILKAELENAAAAIGAKLIPAVAGALTAFRNLIPKLQELGTKAAEVVGPAFEKMGRQIGDSLKDIGPELARALPAFAEFGGKAAGAIATAFSDVAAIVGRSVSKIADVIASHETELRAIGTRLADAFAGAWAVVKTALELIFVKLLPSMIGIAITAINKISGPIDAVVKALGGWEKVIGSIALAFAAWKIVGIVQGVIGALGLMITTLQGVVVANALAGTSMTLMGAAGAVAATMIRTALIASGIGALLLAIGAAAYILITRWDQVKAAAVGAAKGIATVWAGLKDVLLGLGKIIAGGLATAMTLALRVVLEGMVKLDGFLSKIGINVLGGAKAALAGLKSITTDLVADGVEQVKKGGKTMAAGMKESFNGALEGWKTPGPKANIAAAAAAGKAEAAGYKSAYAAALAGFNTGGPGSSGDRTPSQKGITGQTGGTGLTGATSGVNPKVLQFGQAVGATSGSTNVMSGFRKNSKVQGTGAVSKHASGNAIDIGPIYGATLIRTGQDALIEAGMDPKEARKHTSFAGTVNGWEIIFNSQVGGDHTNHVHVAWEGVGSTGSIPPPTADPSVPALADVANTKAETANAAKAKNAATAKTAAKSLADGVKALKTEVNNALKSVNLKDVPEAKSIAADLNKVLGDLADGVASPAALAKLKAAAKKLAEALKNAMAADDIRDSIKTAKAGISAALKEGLIDERTALEAIAGYERVQDLWRKAFSKKSDGGRFVTKKELTEIQAELKAAGEVVKKALEDLSKQMTDAVDTFVGEGLLGPKAAAKITAGLVKFNDLVTRAMRDNVLSPKEAKELDKVWDALAKTMVDGIGPALAEAKKQFDDLFAKGFIDEDTAAGIKAAFASITEALKDGLQPQDLKVITEAWATIKTGVGEAAAALQKAIPKFASFKSAWDEAFKDGLFSDEELNDLKESAGKIGGAIGEGLQAGIDELMSSRDKFRGAIDQFKSMVADVFRDNVILRFQVAIDTADAFSKTTEINDNLEQASKKWASTVTGGSAQVTKVINDVLDAEKSVLEATRAFAQEQTAVNKQRLEQAIKDRQAARTALAAIAQGELADQEKAQLEAGQKLVAAVQEKNAAMLQEEKAGWEATTAATLAQVNGYIDAQIGAFERGEQSWETTLANIRQKLVDSGVDAATAGSTMANAVTSAMTAAASAMTTAMQALVVLIGQLNATLAGIVRASEGHVATMKGNVDEMARLKMYADQLAKATAAGATPAGGLATVPNDGPVTDGPLPPLGGPQTPNLTAPTPSAPAPAPSAPAPAPRATRSRS